MAAAAIVDPSVEPAETPSRSVQSGEETLTSTLPKKHGTDDMEFLIACRACERSFLSSSGHHECEAHEFTAIPILSSVRDWGMRVKSFGSGVWPFNPWIVSNFAPRDHPGRIADKVAEFLQKPQGECIVSKVSRDSGASVKGAHIVPLTAAQYISDPVAGEPMMDINDVHNFLPLEHNLENAWDTLQWTLVPFDFQTSEGDDEDEDGDGHEHQRLISYAVVAVNKWKINSFLQGEEKEPTLEIEQEENPAMAYNGRVVTFERGHAPYHRGLALHARATLSTNPEWRVVLDDPKKVMLFECDISEASMRRDDASTVFSGDSKTNAEKKINKLLRTSGEGIPGEVADLLIRKIGGRSVWRDMLAGNMGDQRSWFVRHVATVIEEDPEHPLVQRHVDTIYSISNKL